MIATRTTSDLEPVGLEERDDPAHGPRAALRRDALEVVRGWRQAAAARRAAGEPAGAATAEGHRANRGRWDGGYQAVAVWCSARPSCSSQRSASIAALQPSPAAVTAWR